MRLMPIFSLLLALCLSAGAEDQSLSPDPSPASGRGEVRALRDPRTKTRLLVQSSPLAGSQYYAVGRFWNELKTGDALTLIREPGNRFDRNAIRVEWQGHRLGYVPRRENAAAAAALDAGDRLTARISRLTEHPDPWQRVEIEIFIQF